MNAIENEFHAAILLTIDLHRLVTAGQGESQEAEIVRETLGDLLPTLEKEDADLCAKVSARLDWYERWGRTGKEMRLEVGKMKTWEFTLELTGIKDPTTELADALFRTGCSDATFSKSEGKLWLDFDRKAESLEEAKTTAMNDIRKAGEMLGVPLEAK